MATNVVPFRRRLDPDGIPPEIWEEFRRVPTIELVRLYMAAKDLAALAEVHGPPR